MVSNAQRAAQIGTTKPRTCTRRPLGLEFRWTLKVRAHSKPNGAARFPANFCAKIGGNLSAACTSIATRARVQTGGGPGLGRAGSMGLGQAPSLGSRRRHAAPATSLASASSLPTLVCTWVPQSGKRVPVAQRASLPAGWLTNP